METDVLLSDLERATERSLTERVLGVPLDWLAVYRLKQRGLAEDSYNGPRITTEGMRLVSSQGIAPRKG